MAIRLRVPHSGIAYAIVAAALFGASTPLSKLLVGEINPVLLASLLYLGSAIGLSFWHYLVGPAHGETPREASLSRSDLPYLAAAICFGGIIGPVLLMVGLATTPGSTGSLLLNLEGVLTALLAWFVFRENFDRRIAFGMICITAGAVVLSWEGQPAGGSPWGAVAIAGACLCWATDNNLTRKVSGGDPVIIALAKGWVAGLVNLVIAWQLGSLRPGMWPVLAALVVGFFGYGVSLTCFVLALRHLGTARTGAYFALAPFVGAALSFLLLKEPLTIAFFIAGVLMSLGVWFHLTERHEHEHVHEPMEHDHLHIHDEHHQHMHAPDDQPGEPHSHSHRHEYLRHSHPHYPDLHHRHSH